MHFPQRFKTTGLLESKLVTAIQCIRVRIKFHCWHSLNGKSNRGCEDWFYGAGRWTSYTGLPEEERSFLLEGSPRNSSLNGYDYENIAVSPHVT